MISSLVAAATLATVFVTPPPAGAAPVHLGWQDFATGSASSFRGLSAVSRRTAWVGGVGEVLRTVDGGKTFQHVAPPGTATLQFRDVEAFDDQHAVILSIGEGDMSRVYVTGDGGTTWTETFRNQDPAAFYDCMAFFDRRHGLALSDPVGGKFRILSTSDGGATWSVLPTAGMPPALDGEFAFAASGTCISAVAGRHAWFGTGGGATARVFRTDDRGLTWKVSDTPIPSGPTAGVYSVVFRDPGLGIAVGGDFQVPGTAPDSAARSADGGRTWTVAAAVPGEYRSGAAWTNMPSVAIAVGPTGSDVTYDAGRTWQRFDTASLHGVQCAEDGACWASGAGGRVARLALS